MKAERIEPVHGQAPRIADTVLADVEALRSSERLQRIFDSDFRSGPAARANRTAAGGGADSAAPLDAGRRGLLGSRRARLLVGLVPIYIGIAVLAADIMRSPEGVAPTAQLAHIGAEPAADTAAAPARPEAPGQVEHAAAAPAPSPGEGAADAPAAPEAGAQVAARAPETPERADLAEAVPAAKVAEPVPAKAAEPALTKMSSDLVKTMDLRAMIRGRLAAARAAQARGARASATAEGDPGRDLGEPAEALMVPQPTWPARATPVPVPAPYREQLSAAPPATPQPNTVETVPQARAVTGLAEASTTRRDAAEGAPTVPQSAPASARIVLHFRGGDGEEMARRLASTLHERGLGRTELRRVPLEVSEANVRFFHDENRPVARQVGEMLRSMGRGSSVRDFTDFSPRPSVGTVEVWLPG